LFGAAVRFSRAMVGLKPKSRSGYSRSSRSVLLLTSLGYEKFERRDDLDLVFGAMKLVEMIFDELSYQKGTRAAALVVAQARD
jgi:hypothetical protein